MRADSQHQAHGRTQRRFEGQSGMRGNSREQGARAVAAKARFRQAPRRAHRRHTELGQQQRMARHAERRQHVVAQARPGVGERLEERAPGFAVVAQIGGRAIDGTLQQYRGAILQGVSQRSVRVHPLETVLGQRKPLEARRAHGQGMHGGADIVDKSGQRQFGRSRAAADGWRAFVHGDRVIRARQHDGGGKAIRSGPDDHGAGSCRGGQLRYCRRYA